MLKVSICILAHNSEKTIADTIGSCVLQDYPNLEIAIMENGSTDDTIKVAELFKHHVVIHSLKEDIGMGKNMMRCAYLNADIIVFMCADDILTHEHIIADISRTFDLHPEVSHVSRWYYQFIDDVKKPVRGNRSKNILKLADNVSGLAFRREVLKGVEITNDPFIEGASLLCSLPHYTKTVILPYDTVAIRIGNGGSQRAAAYRIAPSKRWYIVAGKQPFLKDVAVGYIQIKNWGTYEILIDEILFSIKLNPSILLRPDFWFFATCALLIPRCILKRLVDFYKNQIGRRITKEIRRESIRIK